ncbi:MAG: 2-oxo acid dehydrogenase subunit E2 [Spirochaetes bacterium]|nr:2-oxo acid dehydrogenase subunit E2 [Spirochaetota bacterium]
MIEKNHEIQDFPISRLATFDVGRIGNKKHLISCFIEVDVTKAREKLKQIKMSQNQPTSFFAWFLKCCACIFKKYPQAHGVLYKKNKLVTFDDIDISIPLEKEVAGNIVPLPLLLKKVNEKSIFDIHAEIQNTKQHQVVDESDFVVGKKYSKTKMKFFFSLPQSIRMIIWHFLLKNPFQRKKSMGTVMVTTTGFNGRFNGWILPKTMHNICIALGTIAKKPHVVKNEIMIRDILHLTITFDHDVIDGAPAARLVNQLVAALENGEALG